MKKPPTPYGYVIFCDDRREEISGKETYIGVYQQTLDVSALPAIIPSLVVIAVYSETAGESDEPVTLHIEMPTDSPNAEPLDQKIEIEKLRSDENREKQRLLTVRSVFEFSPLPIIKEGNILVSVKRGKLDFEIGRLTIRHRPLTA